MSNDTGSPATQPEGAAFPWILEHLLTYPGSYEIPLRTMYTLNATSQNQPQNPNQPSTRVPGNAFPRSQTASTQPDQQNMSTATAAAQLRANLMTHISQLPSQPTSLPPSFITSFVRRCFPSELELVDFPQALTAMDYLKDLEVRRRREVLAALDKLGIDRNDIGHKEELAKKYPGVMQWVAGIEEKERTIEAQYTQIYIGLRRWTLVNEMSLMPFNKSNCLAMLNTLYPPMMSQSQFTQPTAQLTPQILATQRQGFFKYITEVEKKGKDVLSSLIEQHKRPGEATGWPGLRETLDNYLRMAVNVIDECNEITGRVMSPTAASFSSEFEEEARRKVDSAISFGSSTSSQRNSTQSHATRPSTSSSVSDHSRRQSRDKQLPEKPLPIPVEEADEPTPVKPAGSTLERIAREIRKMKSRGNVREDSGSRPTTAIARAEPIPVLPKTPSSVSKERSLRLKRSMKKMKSNGVLRDTDANSRAASGENELKEHDTIPAFDPETMKQQRVAWEAQQHRGSSG